MLTTLSLSYHVALIYIYEMMAIVCVTPTSKLILLTCVGKLGIS